MRIIIRDPNYTRRLIGVNAFFAVQKELARVRDGSRAYAKSLRN